MSSSPSPSRDEIKKYYDVALNLVLECGPIMLEGYSKAEPIFETKTAIYDVVTEYDRKIEKHLITGLQKAFPDSKVIGEEETSMKHCLPELTDAPTWLIDPIDGTNNFVARIPHCCISVALAINKELVVGIIYNPIQNEMYSAWKGNGSYLNGKRISVNEKCTEISRAIIGLEISLICYTKNRDSRVKRVYKLAANSNGSRSFCCAALTLCYVAKGIMQCYHVEDLKPWDTAAGAIILTEAGGVITHTSGGPYDIMKPDLIGASTKELLGEVQKLIEEADAMTECEFK